MPGVYAGHPRASRFTLVRDGTDCADGIGNVGTMPRLAIDCGASRVNPSLRVTSPAMTISRGDERTEETMSATSRPTSS